MATFIITAPDGSKYRVTGDNADGAYEALMQQLGDSTPQETEPRPGLVGGAAASVTNGMLSGFGDEYLARLSSVLGVQPDGEGGANWFDYSLPMGERYNVALDQIRKEQGQFRDDHPVVDAVGNIGGAIVGAKGIGSAIGAIGNGGRVATTAQNLFNPSLTGSMGQNILRGGASGATMGALYGFGEGEGGFGNRLSSAATGAGYGAAFGGAAPLLMEGARMVTRSLANPISNMMNYGASSRASEAVASAMRSAGISADELAARLRSAAADGQEGYRIVDALGPRGSRLMNGVVRSGDGQDAADFIARRQADQGDRVGAFTREHFGFNGAQSTNASVVPNGHVFADGSSQVLARPQVSAESLTNNLTNARGAVAGEAYDAARAGAGAVDIRGALGVIDERIGGMAGSGVAGDSIDGLLSGFRSRLASQPGDKAFAGADSVELSDFNRVLGVKQDVQDAIGKAVRAGENNKARELGKLSSALDEALEASSDGYRVANDGFREASRVIDAVGQGAEMTRRGTRAVDNGASFRAMTPDQQAAARIGYGDRLLAGMEANASPTSDMSKVFRSAKTSAEAADIALSPDLLARRMSREGDMWSTQNRVLGGSRTADNIADQEVVAGDVVGLLGNILSGNVTGAMRSGGNMLTNAATGRGNEARGLLAEFLTSDDVQKAIGPALKSQKQREKVQTLIQYIVNSAVATQSNP